MNSRAKILISLITWTCFSSLSVCQQDEEFEEAVQELEEEAAMLIERSTTIGTGLASVCEMIKHLGTVKQLVPESAVASDVRPTGGDGTEYSVDLSYDGNVESIKGKCFYSNMKSNSSINYIIALSEVHFVRVLPIPDRVSDAQNFRIQVCDGHNCTQCGLVGELQPYQFKTVQCAGEGSGITGNVVRLDNPKQTMRLTVCELEIFGQEL